TPGAAGHDMTRTSALMGTPLYMSPEQMQLSKGVDARTDIWALGVILFELLSGRAPFNAEAVTELAIKVANEPAPALRSFRFDAPEGLEKVIARCLEKDRARRFQTVGELAVALKDFGPKNARISVERVLGTLRKAGLSGDVLPASGQHPLVSVSSPALAGSVPQTDASWGQTAAGAKSNGRAGIGIAIAAVLGVAAVSGALVLRKPATPAAAPSAVAATSPPPATVPTASLAQPSEAADTSVTPTIAVSALPSARPPAAPANPAATPGS